MMRSNTGGDSSSRGGLSNSKRSRAGHGSRGERSGGETREGTQKISFSGFHHLPKVSLFYFEEEVENLSLYFNTNRCLQKLRLHFPEAQCFASSRSFISWRKVNKHLEGEAWGAQRSQQETREIPSPVLDPSDVSSHTNNLHLIWSPSCFVLLSPPRSSPHLLSFLSPFFSSSPLSSSPLSVPSPSH